MNQDINAFLKNFLTSLDAQYNSAGQSYTNIESYATQFGSSLKRDAAIIVNGTPLVPTPVEDAKLQFQKKWLSMPNSSHQLTSFDCHLIPGTNTFIINFAARVKFDQGGKNRLGESADLIQENSIVKTSRSIWGSWFGVNGNLVIDSNINAPEVINSLDYRFTYVPKDTTFIV
ncbi:MTR2 [Candida margitis]|uniref:MTR2 n=1 Tax=Candida margitis TaxID=1775924 RepID=UPI00222783E6|nr:MTR2 [Candida margitis]KAI5952953.1 MTR2 [Candida margitis]